MEKETEIKTGPRPVSDVTCISDPFYGVFEPPLEVRVKWLEEDKRRAAEQKYRDSIRRESHNNGLFVGLCVGFLIGGAFFLWLNTEGK